MSQEGSPKRSSARLASAFAPQAVTGGDASAGGAPVVGRATTLGGIQRTKFAPVVPLRKAKVEPTETSVTDTSAKTSATGAKRGGHRPARGGRGRGAGSRGGGGLLGDRNAAPAVVSGPFSLGPTQAPGKGRTTSASFVGGVRNGGSGAGGMRAGADGPRSRAALMANFGESVAAEDVADIERMMELEALSLGPGHTPVYVGSSAAKEKKSVEGSGEAAELPVADLIDGIESLCLFQLPPRLPKLAAQVTPAPGDFEGKPQASGEWPEDIEGQYGRLLVHASGRVSLELGGIRFQLDPGALPGSSTGEDHLGGAQAFVAIDPEYEQSFELGQVGLTLVASPDVESIFTSALTDSIDPTS